MPLYFFSLWRINHSRACAEVRGVPPTALGRLGGPAEGPAAVGRRGVPVPSVDHAAQDRQDLLDGARRVYSPLFCWIAAGQVVRFPTTRSWTLKHGPSLMRLKL